MNQWTCERCEQVSAADLQRAAAFVAPTDPDTTCAVCGVPLRAELRTVLLLERLALAQAAPAPLSEPLTSPAPVSPGMLYSLRETARALHLDRSGKLARAIEAGLVRTVAVGRASRVPGEELLRLLREGLPELPDARQPPAPKTKRRARKARPAMNGSIAKIPL